MFCRKLWSLSLLPKEDIVNTYKKIVEDAPVWKEDEDGDHGAGEMMNDGMRNFLAYFKRTWVSFCNFIFCQTFLCLFYFRSGVQQTRPEVTQRGRR